MDNSSVLLRLLPRDAGLLHLSISGFILVTGPGSSSAIREGLVEDLWCFCTRCICTLVGFIACGSSTQSYTTTCWCHFMRNFSLIPFDFEPPAKPFLYSQSLWVCGRFSTRRLSPFEASYKSCPPSLAQDDQSLCVEILIHPDRQPDICDPSPVAPALIDPLPTEEVKTQDQDVRILQCGIKPL